MHIWPILGQLGRIQSVSLPPSVRHYFGKGITLVRGHTPVCRDELCLSVGRSRHQLKPRIRSSPIISLYDSLFLPRLICPITTGCWAIGRLLTRLDRESQPLTPDASLACLEQRFEVEGNCRHFGLCVISGMACLKKMMRMLSVQTSRLFRWRGRQQIETATVVDWETLFPSVRLAE